MRSHRILSGLALLSLMTCLPACTATAPMRPAAALLQPCAEPAPPTDHTLGGLVQSVHDYQTALDFCNAQLDGLRALFNPASSPSP
ncbi:Rz1-like lysis system protein LysC [Burkholderia vietnamiensis]|uniref:Rz1-like lysis system protein LysC n=2 Tax=Burkholderia vietnamiensis TaxID=60552 RepID=UPI003C7A1541